MSRTAERARATRAPWLDLKTATIAFMVALAVHGADHFRRGTDILQPAVLWGGTVQSIFGVVVLVLVLREVRSAPTWAMVLGFGSMIIFGQAHLFPHFGPTSDSFLSAPGVTWFSWVTAVLEMGMGLVLGLVALRARREARGVA